MALIRSLSLGSTAREVVTEDSVMALWPAAEGRPNSAFTIQSAVSKRPQPPAPGTGRALSFRVAPLKPTISDLKPFGSRASEIVPLLPLTGWFGGGGAVVPAVGLSTIGALSEPM